MFSSRFFYSLAVLLLTSSCSSSLYDVWQGYEDIEPPAPKLQTKRQVRTTSGELEEVVARASIANESTYTKKTNRVISKEELQAIYKMAEEQSAMDLKSDVKVPDSPPRVIRQSILSPEKSATSEVTKTPKKMLLTDELISESEYTPLVKKSETTIGSRLDTMIIGGSVPAEKNDDSDAIIVANIAEAMPTQTQTFDDGFITVNVDTLALPETSEASINFLANQITYNKDSNRLSTKDIRILKTTAASYKKSPAKVNIIGYAINYKGQSSGDALKLAEQRAQKIATTLKKYGVKAKDITTASQVYDANIDSSVAKDVTEIYFAY